MVNVRLNCPRSGRIESFRTAARHVAGQGEAKVILQEKRRVAVKNGKQNHARPHGITEDLQSQIVDLDRLVSRELIDVKELVQS
jgi:hypothetical protein